MEANTGHVHNCHCYKYSSLYFTGTKNELDKTWIYILRQWQMLLTKYKLNSQDVLTMIGKFRLKKKSFKPFQLAKFES